jgi:adenosylcobinamide-phosphate synthase
MLLFGVTGAFVYKAINTLDSMVGYRNRKYENFGKFSAKLDDIANFIPARVTAILIGVLFFSRESLKKLWRYGRLHKSPNAGYPISAMALALGLKLGGDTFYFGKLQKKPFFGEGRVQISQKDVTESLTIFNKFSFFLLLALFFANIFVCS